MLFLTVNNRANGTPFVSISGNTYKEREKLKALGAKWKKENSTWEVDKPLVYVEKALYPNLREWSQEIEDVIAKIKKEAEPFLYTQPTLGCGGTIYVSYAGGPHLDKSPGGEVAIISCNIFCGKDQMELNMRAVDRILQELKAAGIAAYYRENYD